MLKRTADLCVEGLENVPASGPVILAARHYHHQIDGEALLATLPRPTHLMVALDWAGKGAGQAGLAAACRAARWPAVIRADSPFAVDANEQRRALRIALRESLELLREGRILAVFPEGYPNIDANPTPKTMCRPFLPFKDGFVRLAEIARAEGMATPILPVGFAYEPGPRWRVAMRFGSPLQIRNHADVERVRAQTEAAVIALSRDIASRG
jgi:1-acyl-sn-glycerol-3-phosphate acyltransferase